MAWCLVKHRDNFTFNPFCYFSRMFIVVVYFVIDSVRKLLDTPLCIFVAFHQLRLWIAMKMHQQMRSFTFILTRHARNQEMRSRHFSPVKTITYCVSFAAPLQFAKPCVTQPMCPKLHLRYWGRHTTGTRPVLPAAKPAPDWRESTISDRTVTSSEIHSRTTNCWRFSLVNSSNLSSPLAQWYSAGLRAGSGVRVPTGSGNLSRHHRVQTCSGA
jgi:hypothetical protein